MNGDQDGYHGWHQDPASGKWTHVCHGYTRFDCRMRLNQEVGSQGGQTQVLPSGLVPEGGQIDHGKVKTR